MPLPDPLGPSMVTTGTARLVTHGPRRRPSSPAARATSRKFGNDVATSAVFKISIGAAASTLATANDIAMRWSPRLSTVPPRKRPPMMRAPSGRSSTSMPTASKRARHDGDAVGFLLAQLVGAADDRRAVRRGGRDEQDRKFVDRERHELGPARRCRAGRFARPRYRRRARRRRCARCAARCWRPSRAGSSAGRYASG